MPSGNQVEKRSRKPASRYSPESEPKRRNIPNNPSPEKPVYNKDLMKRDARQTRSQPGNHVGIGRGRGRPINFENCSSGPVVGEAQACQRPPNPSGRATFHRKRSVSPLPGVSNNYHHGTPKPAEDQALNKSAKKVVKKTSNPTVKAAVNSSAKSADNSSAKSVSKAGSKSNHPKPSLSPDMFDASPSQPQQPCPSDDDANAQQIELSNSRDSSSDSSKEYLPQKYNREDDDGTGDEEASDVDQQTGFAENDRDIPASNFSSTPKTNINKRRSRLEFGHDEDDQSEAAPQHEKIRIEFNQDSLLKLFQMLPKMHSTMNEVLRRQENMMRHLKMLDQKMEAITSKLAGVTNNAGPSESEHVARLLLKLPLNSVNEMTEFVGEINDAIADKSITIGYLVSKN
ncbi:uncharacterized protein LOC116935448 [Daphnia magna]|uniref:uncharacterized protein LOC116935448 n=1 Tax=Daphnia magna TaxID=35525 RepID=UPI001E1BD044|nr:uncharacterized protein LOC116935448 [Daphnia magna]